MAIFKFSNSFFKFIFGFLILLFWVGRDFAFDGLSFDPALASYLQLVLEHNPTIQSQRYTLEMSTFSVQEQLGPFEPQLQFKTTKSQDDTDTLSTFANKASISQKFSMGGTLALSIQNTQLRPTSSYTSTLGLDFTQPLLKNFGDRINQYSLLTSKIELEKARLTFSDTVYGVIAKALDLYGQYFLALKRKEILTQKADLAHYLMIENQRKEVLHLVDSIEVLSAQIEYQTAQSDLTSALYVIRELEGDLRLVMGVDQIPSFTVTDTAFQIQYQADPSLNASALENNSSVKLARYNLQKSHMALDYFQNQGLPDFSFFANAGYAQTNTGFLNSFGFTSPSYSLGFNIGMPFGNIQARSQIEKQGFAQKQAQLTLETTLNDIQNQLNKACLDVELKERIISDQNMLLALSKQKLVLEKKKFDLGVNTTDKVITAQQAVSNAELTYYQALIDYVKAVVLLKNLKGEGILEMRNGK